MGSKAMVYLLAMSVCLLATSVIAGVSNVTTPVCTAKADIVFILDSSQSITQANYDTMLTFVEDVVNTFDIGPNKIQVGAEIFSDSAHIQFHLNTYTAIGPLVTAIGQIPKFGLFTYTGKALKEAYSTMFQTINGDRPGVPNIAIVITDGKSTNPTNTVNEANNLQAHGVQVFAVGVGSDVDTAELNAVATDPDNTHVLTVADFSDLTTITAQLSSQACADIGVPCSEDAPCDDCNAICDCETQRCVCAPGYYDNNAAVPWQDLDSSARVADPFYLMMSPALVQRVTYCSVLTNL